MVNGLLNGFPARHGGTQNWMVYGKMEKIVMEFQDPKMEILYHVRPYFVGIFRNIQKAPYSFHSFHRFLAFSQ